VSGLARCEWCGVFVSPSKPLTAWRVRVAEPVSQKPGSSWNYWARLLCTADADAIHVPPTWERVTLDEAIQRRGVMAVIRPTK
jgi:hypothetical protein